MRTKRPETKQMDGEDGPGSHLHLLGVPPREAERIWLHTPSEQPVAL